MMDLSQITKEERDELLITMNSKVSDINTQ